MDLTTYAIYAFVTAIIVLMTFAVALWIRSGFIQAWIYEQEDRIRREAQNVVSNNDLDWDIHVESTPGMKLN